MHIHVVITARRCDRLPNISESREMHDRIDPICRKDGIKRGDIADIPFNQLPPANKLAMTEQQAIEYDAFMSCSGKALAQWLPT